MLILKGIIIGIGKIIPGVSGSMLAISMGIYEKLINSINNIFNDFKTNFKFLIKIGIGVIISIVLLSNIIIGCLNSYYLITILFFIGLIIGSLDEIKINLLKKNNYIVYIVLICVLLLGILNINNEVNINNNLLSFIFYIIVGFIDALTMVIPGISGTATLMMIGAYNKLMNTYSNILNINLLIDNLVVLIPFFIGVIIGIFITSKIISYLFKYYKEKTYSAIYGFTISTIVLMFIKSINSSYGFMDLVLGFIFLFIGIFITKKINHYKTND